MENLATIGVFGGSGFYSVDGVKLGVGIEIDASAGGMSIYHDGDTQGMAEIIPLHLKT